MTLRLRLMLFVVGLTTLLLGALGAVVVGRLEPWVTEVVDGELTRRAEVLQHEVKFDDDALRLDDDDDLGHRGLPFRLESERGEALLSSELAFPAVEPRGLGFTTEETARGERLRVLSVAFQPGESRERLVLRVAAPLTVVSHIADRVRLGFLLLLVVAAVLGAAGAAAIAQGVSAPMRKLAGQLDALTPGEQVASRGLGPELGRVAAAFNGLLARLAAVFEGQRAFVGRASHALRTPLASILMETDVALRKERDAAGYRAALEQIAATARDASQLADGLLALTRADAAAVAPKERFAVRALGDEVERLFQPRCAAKQQTLTVEVPAEVELVATRGRVRELVDALLDNAVRYTPKGGRVAFRARKEGGVVVLEVSDSGPGFSAEERAQVFERFFRGRAAEQSGQPGSGLGLALVKALADAEGATVTVGDAVGGGAVVSVLLPG
ncbi:MAG: HAMP domain-containing sensor histidine kinase [Myxococcaceae bacterium]